MSAHSDSWPDRVVKDMVARLAAEATPERAEKEKAYLRSDLECLGATVPAIRRAVVAVRRASPQLSHAGVVRLVDALWGRGIHELRTWLEPRLARAAGLTVREALKYVPEPDRSRLMEAYRAE
jgi:hypothetical protein